MAFSDLNELWRVDWSLYCWLLRDMFSSAILDFYHPITGQHFKPLYNSLGLLANFMRLGVWTVLSTVDCSGIFPVQPSWISFIQSQGSISNPFINPCGFLRFTGDSVCGHFSLPCTSQWYCQCFISSNHSAALHTNSFAWYSGCRWLSTADWIGREAWSVERSACPSLA